MLTIVKSALLYFALVFGSGFALGMIRVPWLVPRFGARVAELIEMPVMLMITYFAARWIVKRPSAPATRGGRIAVGLLALGVVLMTEFSVVLWLQGITIRDALANRDPISGTAYALSLLVFALMPLILGHTRRCGD